MSINSNILKVRYVSAERWLREGLTRWDLYFFTTVFFQQINQQLQGLTYIIRCTILLFLQNSQT
jgi:hypothetical protein